MTTGRQPTRRDFLQGRAAGQAILRLAAGQYDHAVEPISLSVAGCADRDSPPLAAIASFSRRAMACEFEVQLAAGRRDGSAEQVLAALDLVEQIEDQLTVYRAQSELMHVNRSAAAERVTVEPRLFALLQLAERLRRETGGAFDVTTGPLSEVWGFSRRQGRVPSEAEIAAALERVGMDKVVLDAASCGVSFRRDGVALHLNCIGKGYALDRMAESLDAAAVGDYLLHGGRSSVLARGDCPASRGTGWTIGVPHPFRPGERLGEIVLRNQALGTSGSGTQYFEHEGRRYGHLLDPRTGHPVSGICSATVIAPTATEADALSTAFYVMGIEQTADYCASRSELAAILVSLAEHGDDVLVTTIGWEANRWRPAYSEQIFTRTATHSLRIGQSRESIPRSLRPSPGIVT